MKEEYKNPKVMIVENGYSDSGEIEDNGRVQFYKVKKFKRILMLV